MRKCDLMIINNVKLLLFNYLQVLRIFDAKISSREFLEEFFGEKSGVFKA